MRELEFPCKKCENPIKFSLIDPDLSHAPLSCSHCDKQYDFSDNDLQRQIRKFFALCEVIHDSEEILGETSVGVDVGPHNIQIPFRLLLTRLGTTLHMQLDEETIDLTFRHEPIRDFSPQQGVS